MLRPESAYYALREVDTVESFEKYHWSKAWDGKWYSYARWSFPPTIPIVETNLDALETRSAFKVQQWISGLSEEFDTSVFLGELPQVAKHLESTARDLVTAFLALKKGRISRAFHALGIKGRQKAYVPYVKPNGKLGRKWMTATEHRRSMTKEYNTFRKERRELLKYQGKKIRNSRKNAPDFFAFASSKWLELQYGWYPMIGDIDKMMRLAITGIQSEPAPEIRKRISTKMPVKIHEQEFRNENSNTVTGEARMGYDLIMRLQDPVALADYAFGIGSSAPMLWEVLPFSFVVDWFVPVGDYLKEISVPTGMVHVRSTRTTKISYTAYSTGKADRYPDLQPDIAYVGGNHAKRVHKSFRRETHRPPVMTPTGIIAHVDTQYQNFDNAITAIALLKTIFLSKG